MSLELFQRWFEQRLARDWAAIGHSVTIEYKYQRAYGARGEYASVVLSAHEAGDFSFCSKAVWPNEDYTGAVLEGLLGVLMSHHSSPILKGAFVLEEVGWHEVDSCRNAFYQAAKLGTRKLLRESGYLEPKPLRVNGATEQVAGGDSE